MNKNWQEDPRLKNIDQKKLEMLQGLAEQGAGKDAQALLPFLMNAASQGPGSGLSFSPEEISAVIDVLKSGKSPRERAKLDKIVGLMRMIRR